MALEHSTAQGLTKKKKKSQEHGALGVHSVTSLCV